MRNFNKMLLESFIDGKTDLVKKALKNCADVNVKYHYGFTAINHAIHNIMVMYK